ncbi:unnamed protein product [Paramecium pentaurelia]|uniref:Uncharacterized protein n=1 Tax=Paramecium pentaurelia TaxID=43138 RepID=A0A8S1WV58_9CILI|nr:unnamed protein product [Paramecium pentaurelia]
MFLSRELNEIMNIIMQPYNIAPNLFSLNMNTSKAIPGKMFSQLEKNIPTLIHQE